MPCISYEGAVNPFTARVASRGIAQSEPLHVTHLEPDWLPKASANPFQCIALSGSKRVGVFSCLFFLTVSVPGCACHAFPRLGLFISSVFLLGLLVRCVCVCVCV
ncbi:hypothetical protein FKM82_003863 [Ascaphus truei]